MLIGGRPLPERPLWVRLLTIVLVLSAVTPLIRFAYAQLPVFGINRPPKLTAAETVTALPARLGWRVAGDIRCVEHRKTTDWSPGRDGAWDYICTFVPQGTEQRLKVGVRVRHEAITDVSQAYMFDALYVK